MNHFWRWLYRYTYRRYKRAEARLELLERLDAQERLDSQALAIKWLKQDVDDLKGRP